MKKAEAIKTLGGSVSAAAAEVSSTYQAVDKWPDDLPARIADRVVAAFARKCDRENRREDFWAVLRGTNPVAGQQTPAVPAIKTEAGGVA